MKAKAHPLLKKLSLKEFKPLPFLDGGFSQTIAAAYWPVGPDKMPRDVHDIHLFDGDILRIIENRPLLWKQGDRIVILVHGLAGNAKSPYMVRLAKKLYSQGYLVLRVNLRGCGEGFGYAKNLYHSGRSEDIRTVIRWAEKNYSQSPVTLMGFSLGANITLKLAGEDGDKPTGQLDSFVAVSPPVHLAKTAEHLRTTKNIIFDQFFVWKLRADIMKLHRQYPDLPTPKIPLRINLTDIDDLYTAPRSGFKDAQDYYGQSSSFLLVPKIKIKGLILCAEDDPIIDARTVKELDLPSSIELLMTPHGGHVGFLGKTQGVHWMDQVLVTWTNHIKNPK